MGVTSHNNIVYRDMPYKMVMHNTEGDSYYLYDELDNQTTMTPFVFDEEQISNPEFLETMNELKDNFIHGDIYQNDNYMNILTKEIEKLGDISLSAEERQFLKETICGWAKRSRYVQEFTSDFDKIGIDISNILYEEDPVYRDLKEDIQKSEERNLEKASQQIDDSSDVIINETNTEQLKSDGINIDNSELPNTQEDDVSENLDNIDPAMMEQVKEEKELINNKEKEEPQKVVEVIRTENYDEKKREEPQPETKANQQENVVEQEPMDKQIAEEEKPAVGASNEATSNQFEPVTSVMNDNGTQIVVDSKYILKKENDYDNNPVMYDCWKKLTYLDADRNIGNTQQFESSLETTIDRAVTPEEFGLIKDNINSWIQTGGVAAEMQETLQKYLTMADTKSQNASNNYQEGFMRRDILNAVDYIRDLMSKQESDSIDLATSKYLSMMDILDSHPLNVSDEKIDEFRDILNGQKDMLVNNNPVLKNLNDDNQVMMLFHRKQAMIDNITTEWSKGREIKQSDIERVQLLMEQLDVIMQNAPANFNSYYKNMYAEYITNKKDYIVQALHQQSLDPNQNGFKASFDELRNYMRSFDGRMSMNDISKAQELLANAKAEFEKSSDELTEEEKVEYRQYFDSYGLYINGQVMMLEDEESVSMKM